MYDIFYIGNNSSLQERFPFAKQIDSEKDIKSKTKLYWLVEPNIKITDWSIFDYVPDIHINRYIHIWKWDSANYGGLYLKPKSTTCILIHIIIIM